ncbi:hypothetical protein [Candidatus Tisiphia endosymbiont of Oplodontha viridula]|uniref:hypothetical protein n=1 Tax=Candidatus Tisiphia endosymbiont of Oplodontha viridula TaxID=3077925 RepID=UPI0035C93915
MKYMILKGVWACVIHRPCYKIVNNIDAIKKASIAPKKIMFCLQQYYGTQMKS